VSSIAYKVCNEINTKTNFSEAAADILNNSAFVQMYTEAKKGKGEFIIQGFNTVWPSKLFTDVTLEAQKSYSSTSSSGGKLVFNINKEPKSVANQEDSATTDAPGVSQAGELVDYIPPRSKITAPKDDGVDRREKTLGRAYKG
jgi:Tfp pilus assembly protein PilE